VAFSDGPFWPIDTTYYVRNVGGHDWRFLYYLLKYLRLDTLNSDTAVPGLKRESALSIGVALPPHEEQVAIGDLLARIERTAEIEGRAVATTRELKQAAMQRFFTRGLGGEEQKETEIGPVPRSWDLYRIGDRCERPQYGVTASATTERGGPQFLRITDITDLGVDWSTVPYCRCTEEEESQKILKSNDIVFARIGATTGKSIIVSDPPRAVFASYLIRLRTKAGVDADYLYHFFNSSAYWAQVNANKGNNLKGGVSASILSAMLFPVPPIDEQQEIARLLNAIDHATLAHQRKRMVVTELFDAVLQELMNGRMRVSESTSAQGTSAA